MDLRLAFGGFIVGILIGLTGMGGGSLMTPMLIVLFHMKSSMAVGTDLVYASITKVVGGIQHLRQRTVDLVALKYMSIGSIPGAMLGSLALVYVEHHVPIEHVNHVVNIVLGIVYLLIVAVGVWRWRQSAHKAAHGDEIQPNRTPRIRLTLLGLFGGIVVGFTSVGSGSIYIAVLGLIYPIVGAKMVGTDILEGVIVTGVAAMMHLVFGQVNLHWVLNLLLGSIPGILLGSRLSVRMPTGAVKVCIWMMLCWSSWSLIVK